MKRQQQALSPGMPKSLQPGHYLSWQQRIYRVSALDPEQPLVIHVETIPTGERVQLALAALFASPQKGQGPPLFATSLEALDAQLAQRSVPLPKADPAELPTSFLVKAQIIVQTVEMVSRLVREDERRARGSREAWSRTQGYWIDPERCGQAVPENLVTELLDPTIPMRALLENPEKAALLTRITMPSRAWFSGYASYLEATADTGQQLMNQRLGKEVWEQYHLVFETFVHRAQLPLQYVFADHWLVNAWIVDEETRSQASRLWLTLLIDAYSRSIVGMTLLAEEPCIESMQSALRHTILSEILPHASGP